MGRDHDRHQAQAIEVGSHYRPWLPQPLGEDHEVVLAVLAPRRPARPNYGPDGLGNHNAMAVAHAGGSPGTTALGNRTLRR